MEIVDIFTAAKALKDGEVIVIPTETVYGIAADARNNSAVELIYKIKGRPNTKPLQLMVADIEKAKEYLEFSARDEKVAKKFLPGPLTMVLKEKPHSLSDRINTVNDTIGLRISDHEILQSLLKELDFPIVATSANISGNKEPVTVQEAIENLDHRGINYALDGGRCKISTPTTVADFTDQNKITILRNGVVTLRDLESYYN